MFDDLFTEFLMKVYPHEYVDMINSAREALLRYDYSLVEANLYKTSPEDSDIDIHTSKMLMEQCIKDGFNQVFSAIGVRATLNNISEMDCVLRAFRNLEESTDHKSILDVINREAISNEERIIELLMMFTLDSNIHNCVFGISLMDPDITISRLYDYHMEGFIDTYGTASDERVDPEKMQQLMNFVDQNPQTILAKRFQERNLLMDRDFAFYIEDNRDELLKLYPTFPKRTPIEFLGFAILAGVPFFEISGTVKTAISKFYGDLRFTTQTNVLVDKLMQDVQYKSHKVMGGDPQWQA